MGLKDPLPIENRNSFHVSFQGSTEPRPRRLGGFFSDPNVSGKVCHQVIIEVAFFSWSNLHYQLHATSCNFHRFLPFISHPNRPGTSTEGTKPPPPRFLVVSKKKEETEICIPKPVLSLQNFYEFLVCEVLSSIC